MILLRLYWEFFKTGLFAVGGGLATLPFLQNMAVRTGWFTASELTDMLAVSECTPGAIGINMATYAGFKAAGVPGALCSTLGIITPSIIVIIIVARLLNRYRDNKIVQGLFYGLRPASGALIGAACVGVGAQVLLNIGDATTSEMLSGTFTWNGADISTLLGIMSVIRWRAVVFALILWLLMNLGRIGKFKENAVLKKMSMLHPGFYLAGSALVGILLGSVG